MLNSLFAMIVVSLICLASNSFRAFVVIVVVRHMSRPHEFLSLGVLIIARWSSTLNWLGSRFAPMI